MYLASKDLRIPKGRARKLVPKFIGPYIITKEHRNDSFVIELPPELKQRGVHNVFHSSKLRIHIPNDDRLFPGRLVSQVADFAESTKEWAVERIVSHKGASTNAHFEVEWKSGDRTWMPYDQVSHLNALRGYFEVLGVDRISDLKRGSGIPPDDDPQVFCGALRPVTAGEGDLNEPYSRGDANMSSLSKVDDKFNPLHEHPFFRFTGRGYICRTADKGDLVEFSREEVHNFLLVVKPAIDTAVKEGRDTPELPDRYVEFAGIYNKWDDPLNEKLVGRNNEPIAVPSACMSEEGNGNRGREAFEPGDPLAVPFPEPGEVTGGEEEWPAKEKRRVREYRDKRPKHKESKPPPVPYLHTAEGRAELLRDMSLTIAARATRQEMNKASAMADRRARRLDRERQRDERRERPRKSRKRDGTSRASTSHDTDDRMVE